VSPTPRQTGRLTVSSILTSTYTSAGIIRTFIRLYSLFRSDRLGTNFKLTLHKALIRSVKTFACPAWEFVAHTHLMKLRSLQNKVLCISGKFSRNTLIHDMHMAFQIPYIYNYINKLCRQQAQVIQKHENIHVNNIGQGEARRRKCKRLKYGGSQAYDCSID
jgi:hypothetical protein